MQKAVIESFVLTLLIILMIARVAFADIKLSTGGMLSQVLATSLALLSGIALVFSRRIRMLFARPKTYMRSLSAMRASESANHIQECPSPASNT